MLMAALVLFAQDASDPGKCEAKPGPIPWFARETDYPVAARAAGEEGKVSFTVNVDAEGCVAACTVTDSSGSANLDEETCALIVRNARFKPMRLPDGTRIASTFRYSYWWFLPEPLPAGATAPEPLTPPAAWMTSDDYPRAALRAEQTGDVLFTLSIDAAGIPTDCQLVGSSGVPILDTTTCALTMARARFKPARDAAGVPMASRWKNMIRWAIP